MSSELEQARAILVDLRLKAGAKATELPAIGRDEPPWSAMLRRLKDHVNELLRSWFPQQTRLDFIPPAWLFTAAARLACAVVVVGLVYALVRYLRRPRLPRQATLQGVTLWRQARLEQDLSAALAAADFPLATRLRWRLHLERCRLPPALTPVEYPQLSQRGELWGIYRAMYGGQAELAQRAFSAFDADLKQDEAG